MFAPPLSLASAPQRAPALSVRGFEALPSGASVLLRVSVDRAVNGLDPVLIMADGTDLEVIRPLPGSGATLGFAIAARSLHDQVRFWLEIGGRSHALGAPEMRTAHR